MKLKGSMQAHNNDRPTQETKSEHELKDINKLPKHTTNKNNYKTKSINGL